MIKSRGEFNNNDFGAIELAQWVTVLSVSPDDLPELEPES